MGNYIKTASPNIILSGNVIFEYDSSHEISSADWSAAAMQGMSKSSPG
jgi:hypothetical protein